MGFGQGTIFPALTVLLAHWIPKKERGAIGALVLGSGQMGTIISFSGSGILLEQYPWPYVFYLFGGLGLVWCFLFVCAYNYHEMLDYIKGNFLHFPVAGSFMFQRSHYSSLYQAE